jgi:hypothetical protein
MHVSSRNNPDELVGIPQSKGDVQPPAFNGHAQSMKVRLGLVVLGIGQHQQPGIEKTCSASAIETP